MHNAFISLINELCCLYVKEREGLGFQTPDLPHHPRGPTRISAWPLPFYPLCHILAKEAGSDLNPVIVEADGRIIAKLSSLSDIVYFFGHLGGTYIILRYIIVRMFALYTSSFAVTLKISSLYLILSITVSFTVFNRLTCINNEICKTHLHIVLKHILRTSLKIFIRPSFC